MRDCVGLPVLYCVWLDMRTLQRALVAGTAGVEKVRAHLLRLTPDCSEVVSSPFMMTLPSSATKDSLLAKAVSRSV